MVKDSLGNIIEIGDEVERVNDSFNKMKVGDRAIVMKKEDSMGGTIYLNTYSGRHAARNFKIISKNKQQNNLNLIL